MQMMRSDEYLIKCAEKRMESYMRTADKTARNISDVYQRTLKDLIKPLESIYKGLNSGISIAEAKRIMKLVDSNDVDNFFFKVIDNISDLDTKQIMQNEFNKPAIKSKVSRIKQLVQKIKSACKAVAESTTKLTDDCLSELIPHAYYHSAYDKQYSSGMGMFLSLLTEERIDEIRLTNWSGIRYAKRIRNNSTRLADLLTAEVLSGFLTKKNQLRMAEIMTQRIAEAFNRSYTLLRTEACFVTNQAELQSYVDNAVEKYRYVAVLDMRTSKMCRLLDGQKFDVDKAIVGINFPPLHPHCRSTTRPVIDGEDLSEQERNATDPKTGEQMTVPADMTYGEWYDKYVNKAKPIDLFNDYDVAENYKITSQKIVDDLSTSAIGRQTLRDVGNLPKRIKLTTEYKENGVRGDELNGEIRIFLRNCKDEKWAARTIIHECTHWKYGIGYSQWSEAVCVAQELKHARNRDYLTISEKRSIIKAVKETYPELNWKKGGMTNGRKKR